LTLIKITLYLFLPYCLFPDTQRWTDSALPERMSLHRYPSELPDPSVVRCKGTHFATLCSISTSIP